MNTEEMLRKSAMISDLLRVIEHCHEDGNGHGLSAVIYSAQEHAKDLNKALDITCNTDASDETEIMKLFRERQKLRHQVNRLSAALPTEIDDQPLWEPLDRLDDIIERAPAVTAADFAAKIIVLTCDGSFYPCWQSDPIWREARKLVEME